MSVSANIIAQSGYQVLEGKAATFLLRFTAQVAAVSYSYSFSSSDEEVTPRDYRAGSGSGSISFASSSVINEDVKISFSALNDLGISEETETVYLTVDIAGATFSDGSTSATFGVDILNDRRAFGTVLGENIRGESDGDTILGGGGNDTILGLDGSDFLYGASGKDSIFGGKGNDLVRARSGDDALIGGQGNDRLWGEAGNDVVKGDAGNDRLDGGSGADTILGGEGHDLFFGGGGRDSLAGGAGDDTLRGGKDFDELRGGTGRDTFVIEFSKTAKHADSLVDFRAVDDTIALISAEFEALVHLQDMNDSFHLGRTAVSSDDHIIYHRQTGKLYFDLDGVDGEAMVLIAQLRSGTQLTGADFILI